MIHVTIAIADFMTMLVSSALWSAASAAGSVLAGLGLLGGGAIVARRACRKRRG